MSSQEGTFFAGTYGYPIRISMGADLTGATAIALKLTTPSGAVIERELDVSAIVAPATAGNIDYTPAQGETDEAGAYSFRLTFTLPQGELVTEGVFSVKQQLAATLVPEDGTGKANANSFVGLEEADEYHKGGLHSQAWNEASSGTKVAALITATRIIDALVQWRGYRKTVTQALGWPREYALSHRSASSYYVHFDDDIVPTGIRQATAEMARELIIVDRTKEPDTIGIGSVGIGQGAVSVTFDANDKRQIIPELVLTMLKPFGTVHQTTSGGMRFLPVVRT